MELAMCRFIRSPETLSDQVSLAIEAAGGKLMGRLTPPEGAPHMIFLDHVPLLRAVKMAALMADLLDTDVIVQDPLGIWHEWLVEWARAPLGEAEASAAAGLVPSGNGAAVGEEQAPSGVVLH
jgi:hypothetical protein